MVAKRVDRPVDAIDPPGPRKRRSRDGLDVLDRTFDQLFYKGLQRDAQVVLDMPLPCVRTLV